MVSVREPTKLTSKNLSVLLYKHYVVMVICHFIGYHGYNWRAH